MSNIFRKILGVYLLVLALGVTLSALIYSNGHEVSTAIRSLVSVNLPKVEKISQLRTAIFAQKPLLYEFYASQDRAKFVREFEINQRNIDSHFHTIHTQTEDNDLLKRINFFTDEISNHAVKLDEVMRHPSVDWDQAREILAQVSITESRLSPLIDDLVKINQAQVDNAGMQAQSNTDFMILMVIGFSSSILIIALLIGYQVNAYLSENIERKRLAMFPERNPDPVLRMTWEGSIVYSNPATQELQQQLQLQNPMQLFPEEFMQRYIAMRQSKEDVMELEYPLQDRIMHCVVHLLRDLQISHIYVNDITKRKQAEDRLTHQAYHDAMTGLPNRRRLNERLQEAISNLAPQQSLAVLLLRVDRINLVLQSRGYDAGDGMMQALAIRLQELLHEHYAHPHTPFLFRFEGATFGLLLEEMQEQKQLLLLAEQLQQGMTAPLISAHQEYFLTLSIGASIYPLDGHTTESLIRNAEAAVNRVSNNGGNGFQCYTQDMNEMAERWLSMENDLRRALDGNELHLLYQPQINLESTRTIGAEALLRWNRNGNTPVSPADFIPLAEETGLIIPIGAWVLHTACTQAQQHIQQGHTDFVMAVNISARQFQHPEFIPLIASVLHETGLPAANLELEITESLFMHDAEKTIATMQQLRTLGIQLSIDDFGTGYSSLSYLKRFPINKLKVDQSFVRNMCSSPNDASIAKSIILLGQSLNLTVIAEGVETEEQLAMLREYGCDEVQGYLYSRPIPHGNLVQFFKMQLENRTL